MRNGIRNQVNIRSTGESGVPGELTCTGIKVCEVRRGEVPWVVSKEW